MGHAPAAWRFAALSMALLLRVGAAERLNKATGAQPPGGRRPTPRPLLGAAVAALLGATGSGVVRAGTESDLHAETFQRTDTNKDLKVSQSEYLNYVEGEGAAHLEHLSIFAQADIDDDEMLSEAEFLFALHIAAEAAERESHKLIANRLPPDYVQRIDNMFLDLRSAALGVLTAEEFLMAIATIIGIPIRSFDAETSTKLIGLFETADVTDDGFLNNNELDFLQYLTRDALVDAALTADEIARDPDRLEQFQLETFIVRFDADGDGRLAESEVLDVLPQLLEETPSEQARQREQIANLFKIADTDGDAMLDREETREFLSLLTK